MLHLGFIIYFFNIWIQLSLNKVDCRDITFKINENFLAFWQIYDYCKLEIFLWIEGIKCLEHKIM